nr:PAS domain-containing protein [Streptomyces meridianus]
MEDPDDPVTWRNRFLLLLDRMPAPIAVCCANGEVVLANPAMAAEWGTTAGRLPGCNLRDFFRPLAAAQFDRLVEALRLGRRSRYRLAVRWTGPDGTEREGELTVDPVGAPAPPGPLLLAVLDAPDGRPPRPAPEVTPAETRILALAATGATTAEIGRTMGLTTDGVNYHLGRLKQRWRVPNRTAVVAKAYTLGVLDAGRWPPGPGEPGTT